MVSVCLAASHTDVGVITPNISLSSTVNDVTFAFVYTLTILGGHFFFIVDDMDVTGFYQLYMSRCVLNSSVSNN